MSSRTHPYLGQAFPGRSGWFDFLLGGFFVIAAWVLGQMLIGAPIGGIAAELGLEEYREAAMAEIADMEPGEAVGMALGTLMEMLGAAMAFIGYLVARTVGGVGRIIGQVVAVIGVILCAAGIYFLLPFLSGGPAQQALMGEMFSRSALIYGIFAFSFIGAYAGAVLVQYFVHSRTFTSLVTAAADFRWSRLVWAGLLTWGVYGAGSVVSAVMGWGTYEANPERARMLPFVIATLIAIPIQASAEELIFRGYLNQALARFVPSVLVVFALTSLVFGALHLANPEVAAAEEDGTFWLAFAGYALFGFILSLVVWFDHGLEAAMGIHIANNMFAAIFVNYENSVLPIPGLFLTQSGGAVADVFSVVILLSIVCAGLWITRKPLVSRAQVLFDGPGAVRPAGETVEDTFA